MAKFGGMFQFVKVRSRKHSKSKSTKLTRTGSVGSTFGAGMGVIKVELRPGGMLVQKREDGATSSSAGSDEGETIRIKVSIGGQCYGVSADATCTVGELKEVVSLVTGLEPQEQRLLFRGKEREDSEHLHMVGVRDGDKVVVFQDPSVRESKFRSPGTKAVWATSCCPATIEV